MLPDDTIHRSSFDKSVNTSGLKLLQLCKSSNLRIVNGRVGDDAADGQFTYMSTAGCSLIDYAIFPCNLFSIISNFIVHDFRISSSHLPIQVSLEMHPFSNDSDINNTVNQNIATSRSERVSWKGDCAEDYRRLLQSNMHTVENLINKITRNEEDLNRGIDELSDIFLNCAKTVFGNNCNACTVKNRDDRKFKSPWFNGDCEIARREFRSASRSYSKCKTQLSRDLMIACQKRYRTAKKRAKFKYKNAQKRKLRELSESNPCKFWSEIKKFKSKDKKCKIDNASLFNHFRTLFSNENVFVNEETELFLNDDNRESVSIFELDKDFVVEEVISAINCLKRGKSAGIDSLLPEMFIECKAFLSPLLCKLFNYIYTNSLYPASWTKGVIVPVPKKGDLSDVNNYRGITLTSIFSKIFSILLDNRLRKWAENNNVLHDCQYGFRKQRSTVDCIFILSCIIDKAVKREKRKLYCSFVDFKKAFDLVYRNGIWQKLLSYGASTKIVKMLQAIYEKVQSCVRTEGNLSDSFESYSGVKQGEPLSPFLFILFINDMYENLVVNDGDAFTLNDLKIFILLFADDTVLISYTPEGLQNLINQLHRYCCKWGITVNTEKNRRNGI